MHDNICEEEFQVINSQQSYSFNPVKYIPVLANQPQCVFYVYIEWLQSLHTWNVWYIYIKKDGNASIVFDITMHYSSYYKK